MKKVLATMLTFVLFASLSLPKLSAASFQNSVESTQQLQTENSQEIDFYITLGTLPTLYAGLIAFSSTNEGYMWYERKQTLDSSLFPGNIHFLALADPYGEVMLTAIENKIKELHINNPTAKFHLYTDDLRVQFGLQLFLANGVPENQYEITLLSDGTGTYNIFKNLFSNPNSVGVWEQYANDYDTRKAKVLDGETGVISRGNNMDLSNSMYYGSQSNNIEYRMQFPELLTSQDPLVQAEVGNMNTIKISPYHFYRDLTDEQKVNFEKAVGIDKALFEQLFDASPKPNLIISGTSLPGEGGTFEDVINRIVMDYGTDYDLFFKPHPVWNPTNQPDLIKLGRKDFLDSEGITLLPAQLPMEALMWVYPEVKIGGYSSSLYMSTAKEQTVFFITDKITNMSAPLPDLYTLGYFGDAKLYPITLPKDSNADLAELQVSVNGDSIPLSVTDSVYKATLPHDQDRVVLKVKSSSKNAAVSVSKSAEMLVLSGSKGAYQTNEIALPVGETQLDITVKSTDGLAQKSYTVILHRGDSTSPGEGELSNNTKLSKVSILTDTDIPLTVTNSAYRGEVDNSLNSIKLLIQPEDTRAFASVYHGETELGLSKKANYFESDSIQLSEGENSFTVEVTAENNKDKTRYSVVILRKKAEGEPGNGNGSVGGGTGFVSGSQFDLVLPNGTQSIVPVVTSDKSLKLDLSSQTGDVTIQFDVNALQTYKDKETVTSLTIENKDIKYRIPIDLKSVIPEYEKIATGTTYAVLSLKRTTPTEEMKSSLNQSVMIGDPYSISLSLVTKSGEKVNVKEFTDYVTISFKAGNELSSSDKKKIAALAFADEGGQPSVKPVIITEQDGLLMANISTLTHSTYVLVKSDRTFQDVSSTHWANESITEAANRLLVKGVGNGEFLPEQKVSRAEFVTMVIRAFGIPDYASVSVSAYRDVNKNNWYYADILSAQKAGLLNWAQGYDLHPNQAITRSEMAQVLYLAAKRMGAEQLDANLDDPKSFKDFANLTKAEQSAFSWNVQNGVILGVSSNQGKLIQGNGNGTRAQAVTMILRTLKTLSLIN